MLNKQKILEFLQKEGFEEIDEIEYTDKIQVYDLFYKFDEAELDAAKDYSNENYNEANGEDEWYDEFFLPYLADLASDNVRDVIEDLCDEFELTGEFMMYEPDRDSYEQMEFIIVLANEDVDFDIDEVVEELEL